jgi:hypothetical protein
VNKILATVLALALAFSTVQTLRLSGAQGEVAKLRLSERALQESLARNTRASDAYKRELAKAQWRERVNRLAVERALTANPDWANAPVPQAVQDAP